MTRYIDADELKDWSEIIPLTDDGGIDINDFEEKLRTMPTIDAEPVRHAKWIPCAKSGLILTEQMRKEGIRWYGFKCSACNFVRKGNAPRDANYCECCGARMDEDNVE